MMMVDLQDKVALVTGASRGIGRDISLALAECGAYVILSSRNLKRLREVEREISDRNGKATILPVDLTKEVEIINLFNSIKETFGCLHITINNAGIGYFTDIVDFPIEKFDKIVQVNLRGTFL